MKTLYGISTFLILALGLLHISLTPVLFHSFNSGDLWFASGGIVIIFLSFFNFILMSDAGRQRLVRMHCYAANLVSLLFAGVMFIIEHGAHGPGLQRGRCWRCWCSRQLSLFGIRAHG